MEGNEVRILQDTRGKVQIYIDGQKIKNVTGISYVASNRGLPKVILEFEPKSVNSGKKDTIDIFMDGKQIQKLVEEE